MAENGQEQREYSFTEVELAEINKHLAKYPDPKSAVMPALWIAQEKFHHLDKGALHLVADTLNLPFAHVYGVATFYSQYHKENLGKYVIDVCTCFACGELGGDEIIAHARKYADCDDKGRSKDGKFCFREAECLGACDSGVVCQVHNRHYVHNLTKEKMTTLIDDLRAGKSPSFVSIPLIDQTQS